MWLTEKEVERLTRRKRPSAQAQVLRDFIKNVAVARVFTGLAPLSLSKRFSLFSRIRPNKDAACRAALRHFHTTQEPVP